MANWDLIGKALIFLFFSLAIINIIQIIYREFRYNKEEDRRKIALNIYNKREIEFIHDEKKWEKWKQLNYNLCKIADGSIYY